MKSQIVIETSTGKEKIAIYAPNKKGNKQFNVDGKFYTDAKFDRTFTIVNPDKNNNQSNEQHEKNI